MLNGFFDIDNRLEYLTEKGDIRPKLIELVPRLRGDRCLDSHDSNIFESILDETNTSKDVYADNAYRSEEHETNLKSAGFRPHLLRKGCRDHQLTERKKQGNQTRSKVRSRIEHIFGTMRQRAGDVILRTIGLVRAKVKPGLRNIAYIMERFCILMEQTA